MKDKIKQYLDQLNERERNIVYVAAVVLVIFLPYQLVWAPFSDKVEELHEKVEKQENDLLWMRSKVQEIRQLGSMGKKTGANTKSLYGIIENTARQKFGGGIRVQQEGKKGIRVIIKDTGFDDMVIWLDNLQFRHGVFVKEFKVDRAKGIGRVKASLLLEG